MGLTATYDQARALGCILATGHMDSEDYEIERSHGDPCRGRVDGRPCRSFNDGKCPCYRQHHTTAKALQAGIVLSKVHRATPEHHGQVSSDFAHLSVGQIAKKLGISKNEVRRRKQKGEL